MSAPELARVSGSALASVSAVASASAPSTSLDASSSARVLHRSLVLDMARGSVPAPLLALVSDKIEAPHSVGK
jgi:hypothetical protein